MEIKKCTIIALLCSATVIACKSQEPTYHDNRSVVQILSKLNSKDTIDELDLSNRRLKELPDLSHFKVRKLDISNNELDTLVVTKLPGYLVILNASNNKIGKGVNFINVDREAGLLKNNVSKYLSKIDLSHNELEGITIYLSSPDAKIESIDLSYNNLININLMFNKKIEFLDISNNRKFSTDVQFNPNDIKHIKSDNISNDGPLKRVKRDLIIPADKY